VFDSEDLRRAGTAYRWVCALFGRTPGLRTIGQYHRYAF
jgi:hypothetical protein